MEENSGIYKLPMQEQHLN